MPPDPAEQKRLTDASRKIAMAVATLEALAESKAKAGAWGRVTIDFDWKAGRIDIMEFTDRTTVKDMPSAVQ